MIGPFVSCMCSMAPFSAQHLFWALLCFLSWVGIKMGIKAANISYGMQHVMGYWPPPPNKKQVNKKSKSNQKKINLNVDLNTCSDSIIELFNYIRNLQPLHLFGLTKWSCNVYLKSTSVFYFLRKGSIPKYCCVQLLMYHWICICIPANPHKFSKNWNLFLKQPLHLYVAVWYVLLKCKDICIAWKVQMKKLKNLA